MQNTRAVLFIMSSVWPVHSSLHYVPLHLSRKPYELVYGITKKSSQPNDGGSEGVKICIFFPIRDNRFKALCIHELERFSFKCRKTKTKVITLTNHNSRKQSNEPIRARSKYMSPVPSAGKHVRVSHELFWFYF